MKCIFSQEKSFQSPEREFKDRNNVIIKTCCGGCYDFLQIKAHGRVLVTCAIIEICKENDSEHIDSFESDIFFLIPILKAHGNGIPPRILTSLGDHVQ